MSLPTKATKGFRCLSFNILTYSWGPRDIVIQLRAHEGTWTLRGWPNARMGTVVNHDPGGGCIPSHLHLVQAKQLC